MKSILNELDPKGKWVKLTSKDLDQWELELFKLINTAYKDVGGNPKFKSTSDINNSMNYTAIDLDKDPDPEAVIIFKDTVSGRKLVAMGHDGEKDSKRKSVAYIISLFKRGGHYAEVSGKIADILKSNGIPQIIDHSKITNILKGKDIEILPDGSYYRMIGGKKYLKSLFGKPK